MGVPRRVAAGLAPLVAAALVVAATTASLGRRDNPVLQQHNGVRNASQQQTAETRDQPVVDWWW